MPALLPNLPMLAAFLGASFVLAVTPGPGVLFLVTRSLSLGRRAGLASLVGVAGGNMANALAATCGLAAWFAASPRAFLVVKYAGAAYLVFLGLQELATPPREVEAAKPEPLGSHRLVRDAFVVALLNPKTTLFFAAFLPQFMTRDASPLQPVLLGAMFVVLAAITDALYVLGAASVAGALQRGPTLRRVARYFAGAMFVALGVIAALATRQQH